jgi:hypothetical protein
LNPHDGILAMTSNLLPDSRAESGRTDLLERRLRRFHPRFQGQVRLLAARHPHIADLAVSFPALLFTLAVPRAGFDPAPALTRVVAGHSLAEVTAAANLPMWVRKLPAEAFTGPVPKLPNGELFRRQIANHLPPSPKVAATWLEIVADMAQIAHEPAALWIAREFNRAPRRVKPRGLRLIGLWAWFSGRRPTFGHELIDRPWTPDVHFGPAVQASDAWQELFALHLNLGPRPIGDTWLRPAQVEGYDFMPLDCVAAVAEEAASMKNCVRTYGEDLACNQSRLWSVRRNGERVATLEVAAYYRDPLLNISEIKGPGNVDVSREVSWAARRWLHMHDLPHIETGERRRSTLTLDRATWQSLWRPYWLAKRGIPEWLPLSPSRDALWNL